MSKNGQIAQMLWFTHKHPLKAKKRGCSMPEGDGTFLLAEGIQRCPECHTHIIKVASRVPVGNAGRRITAMAGR
jgi:hypothetical protein